MLMLQKILCFELEIEKIYIHIRAFGAISPTLTEINVRYLFFCHEITAT